MRLVNFRVNSPKDESYRDMLPGDGPGRPFNLLSAEKGAIFGSKWGMLGFESSANCLAAAAADVAADRLPGVGMNFLYMLLGEMTVYT